MRNRFYMKNTIVVLQDKTIIPRFTLWTEQLMQDGISVEFRDVQEEEIRLKLSGGGTADARETLWITDSGELALSLKERNRPVLGICREGEGMAGVDYVMECGSEPDVRYLDRVYRRFQDIPWDILETERCILRETIEEDVDSFFEIYSHPDIVRYTENLYEEKEQERSYVRQYRDKVYRYFEFGIWTVIWKETGEIIGRAGLAVREGYELPDMGYIIGVPWQRKGVAYEVCAAIMKYAREEFGFLQVQALVMPENAASIALCKKLGLAPKQQVNEKGIEYIWFVTE